MIWRFPLRGVLNSKTFELVFWLILATLGFYFSLDFDREIEFYRFGAATWPRVILALMVVAAFGQWWTHRRHTSPRTTTEASPDSAATAQRSSRGLRLAVIFSLPLIYAALWEKTRFYLTTPVFLIVYLYCTGERRLPWLFGVPLIISGVLTVIFTRLLYVGLPVGYWHPFYDFSNWLVDLIRS